jgi:hypothetical protein
VIGPFFFDGTVTSAAYRDILETQVRLALFALQETQNFPRIIWQQDGAPAHCGRIVKEYLNEIFLFWIGRGGNIPETHWPPRSPDLTPCDFALWGILKERVYGSNPRPRTVEQLKDRIVEEFQVLRNDGRLCKKITRSVARRYEICVRENGRHFEHLM